MKVDSIFRVSPELFNGQVLLDPFEEYLDLPAIAVQAGDLKSRYLEVVYQKDQLDLFFISVVFHQPEWFTVKALRFWPCKMDGFFASQTRELIEIEVFSYYRIVQGYLGPGDKE
jgi:hypothetical protein